MSQLKIIQNVPIFRLWAVSLFSVVRRAKRETSKWPRAWLMARDDDGSRPYFARLAASPLARACTPLTEFEEKERLLTVWFIFFFFFLFLLYLMFILGRIDGSHFLVYIKNDPTLPLNSQKTGPMAVGGRGGGRHATPSGRPTWHFVFCDPQNEKAHFLIGLFSHRHPNNNQLHWTTGNLSFEREEIWNFSLTCILPFCNQCRMVLHERPVSSNVIIIFLCIFTHNSHFLAKITKFSIWGNTI